MLLRRFKRKNKNKKERFTMKKKYIHVVIGTDLETLWIITAYYPNLDKWKQDLRTRRED